MNDKKVKINKKGFLVKRSKYLKKWKKRFIVLTNIHIFAYTSSTKDAECTMHLSLKECSDVRSIPDTDELKNIFSFTSDGKEYWLEAESEKEKEEWMTAISKAISEAEKVGV